MDAGDRPDGLAGLRARSGTMPASSTQGRRRRGRHPLLLPRQGRRRGPTCQFDGKEIAMASGSASGRRPGTPAPSAGLLSASGGPMHRLPIRGRFGSGRHRHRPAAGHRSGDDGGLQPTARRRLGLDRL